jgi:hypothetical protein
MDSLSLSMKKVILLVVLFSFGKAHSQDHEILLHYGAGLVAGGAGAFLAHEISGGDKWWTIAGAVGTSLLAGVAKEAIDKWEDGNWDNAELAATVAGGVTVGVTIEIFHGRKKRKSAVHFDSMPHRYVMGPDPFQVPSPKLNSR